MGKGRTDTVKKAARNLLEKFPDKFTTDFEQNKKVVAGILEVKTKKLRNLIVGYLTRIKQVELARAQALETAEAEPPLTDRQDLQS